MDLNFSPTPSKVTIIRTMGTIRRKLKQQLVIINSRFDALKHELLTFLRGHAAAECQFCTTQVLNLEQSQATSYLGLKHVIFCRHILNTWRNTAASVGLDLDSSVLWAMVLYFGHGFGQDSGPHLKCF